MLTKITAIELMFLVVIPKRKNKVVGAFSIHQYYVHTTVQRNCTADKIHQEKLEVTSLLRNRDASFSACVSILTRAAYGIMVVWL